MRGVTGAVDHFRLFFLVGREDVFDVHDGQQKPLAVPEGDGLAGLEGLTQMIIDVETDRQGPEEIVLQLHPVQNRRIFGLDHKALERRKSAGGKQFQIAHLALRQGDIRQLAGDILEQFDAIVVHQQIDEFAAVGRGRRGGHQNSFYFWVSVPIGMYFYGVERACRIENDVFRQNNIIFTIVDANFQHRSAKPSFFSFTFNFQNPVTSSGSVPPAHPSNAPAGR